MGALAIATALAVAGTFLLRTARGRALAALAALALAPVLVVAELWDTSQVRSLRDEPTRAALAAAAGAIAVVALAELLRRRPGLLPLLVVVALPIRIPLEAGGGSANLLVPLYWVVAAGVLAFALDRLRGHGRWHEREPTAPELALLAFVGLYALQSLYSTDFEQATKNIAFFYVPFALMLRLLTAAPWSPRAVTRCFAAALAMAAVFVLVGFYEYAAKDLLWNSRVIESNQFESYFRVNSLFFDPNIYGRFLMVVMIGLAAMLLWARSGRTVAVAAALLALLWCGLVLTFSQSSFTALLVGLAALAALRWSFRRVAAGLALCAALALVAALGLGIGADELDESSGNRLELIGGGLSMVGDRPLWGYGSGSFAERFRDREDASSARASSASHTIPVTVAAEQGVAGLIAYIVLVVVSLRLLSGGLGPLSGRDPPQRLVTRAFLAAAYGALVFHTMLYAAYLEDPIAWTLLAIGIVLLRPTSSSASASASSSSASSPSASTSPAPRA
ncbi:MAG TPA: O-antigen ligase family protein [Thermoleophilaceae bacterium]|jgi:O-antigen ligase